MKEERKALAAKLQAAMKDAQTKGNTIAQLLKHSNKQAQELREERSRSASLRGSTQSSPKSGRKNESEVTAKLMTQIREMGVQLNLEKKRTRDAEEQLQQKVQQSLQLMGELNDVTENFQGAQRKVQVLEEQLKQKRDAEGVPQQVQELEDEVAGLKEQTEYLKTTIYDHGERERKMQEQLGQVDELRKQLESQRALHTAATGECETAQKLAAVLKAELQKKTDMVGKLQTTAAMLTQKINELNREGAAGGAAEELLKERIKELEVTNNGLKAEVTMLKSLIKK